MREQHPDYRIGRWAMEASIEQSLVNLWRRLTFRAVLKSGAQAAEEVYLSCKSPSLRSTPPVAEVSFGEGNFLCLEVQQAQKL